MSRYRMTPALLIVYMTLLTYIEARAAFGLPYSLVLLPLSTLLGFSFTLLHAGQRLGWKRTIALLACVFVVSLTFESVGVATGLVYGPYHYDDHRLGPLIFDLVPPLIPVAWFLMLYPALIIAGRLVPAGEGTKRILAVAALGGLVMTAWDLVMEPVMVQGQHWVWEVQGAYFGIPLQNFWGWWLTTFASHIVAALLGGLSGPALVGFFAMTPWVVMGWVHSSHGSSR